MTIEYEPVASDDAIARAMRAALVRTVAATPAEPMSWNGVLLRARRVVIVRRVVGVSLCVVLALGAGAVAFASTSTSGRRGSAFIGSEPTTNTTAPIATSTIDETTTSSTLAPMTTSSAPVVGPACDSCTAVSPPAPAPQPARAGDFTGSLQHWREICDPCLSTGFDKGITVKIRNTTDHPIDLSTAAPVRVAVVCATNMTADDDEHAPDRDDHDVDPVITRWSMAHEVAATPTIGIAGGSDPREPANGRFEKSKIPPSDPTIR